MDLPKNLAKMGLALHLAAANGHVEILNELLKVGCDLCTIEGREKRIPLHYAAIKGRVHVMKILLSACPESVENQTVRGETALLLAVKNNQFEGFTLLVAHLKQFQKESVLNKQDNQGNTILHLASSRKQYEVFNQVLGEDSVTKAVVEVNSLNKVSMTALDVLLLFHSEAGDLEIESILQQAGGKRANDMHSSVTSQSQENHQHGQVPESNIPMEQSEVPTTHYRSRIDQLADYFTYKKGRDRASDVRTALLTIAVLIATATYQSGFSPPGGVWQDDKNDTPKQVAGKSVMDTKNSASFFLFMFGNTIGFYTSLYMIYFLTNGFPLQLELRCSMLAMIITYVSSMGTIAPS
ncbi:Ankyrin repeat-containing protein [Quillaja saponaria]|uniref:Ankyrin repeat-containing protein n=1 Tax=Quillaja saponaria TaxID=32244 RepID=A0AAD7L3M6_QUISA|nr:Ankyrin repeat-containing protein [Quillaja saponaria]